MEKNFDQRIIDGIIKTYKRLVDENNHYGQLAEETEDEKLAARYSDKEDEALTGLLTITAILFEADLQIVEDWSGNVVVVRR